MIQKGDKHTGSIRGRVVDEAGRPMANVVLNVRPAGGSYEEEREAATDDSGEFVVDHLPAKPYTIRCEASGYIDADSSSSYYLIGEPVTLRMTKGGVITGRVTSASGEPRVKARVAAVRVRDENGQLPSLNEGSDTAETDDRGIYRIYGLESGYYLVTVERAGLYDDSQLRNAAPIYYPSVTHDAAQQVAVTRGQEAGGIDITYRSEPGHVVGGTFSGILHADSKDGAYIRLICSKPATVLQEGYKQDRTFLFYGVPDGDYYLVAENDSEGPTAASQPYHLTVKGADVRGIDLRLVPFASASGRVTLERTPVARSKPECKETRAGLVQEAVVWAVRDENKGDNEKTLAFPPAFFEGPTPIAPGDNGDFSFHGLAPGRYRFGASPVNEAVYVSGISMPGPAGKATDIASAGAILRSGDQIARISIVLAEGSAVVRGGVISSVESTKLPSGLRVHLVPAEPEQANNVLRFAETAVKDDGTFRLTNIAPGRYRVVTMKVTDSQSGPAAWDADKRAALHRRSQESASATILELKPCQRVLDYVTRYP